MEAEFLENDLRISYQRFVLLVAFVRMREFEELNFLELMLTKDSARVLSGGARFGAEAGRPRGDVDGEFSLRDGFVPVQIVELDFRSGSQPEVGVFELEKVGGKFR